MKKPTNETIQTSTIDERDSRLAELELRLAKLDPPAPIEKLQPFPIGTEVYGVKDFERSYPLVVRGFDHQSRRIFVIAPDDPEVRSMPLVSVMPLEPQSAVTPGPVKQQEDADFKNYWNGRRSFETAAKTPPALQPPPQKPPRFM